MGEGIAMGGKQGRKKRNWLPLQLAAAMPLATLALAALAARLILGGKLPESGLPVAAGVIAGLVAFLGALIAALHSGRRKLLCGLGAAGGYALFLLLGNLLRRTLRGSTAGPAAAGRCGAARRSARGRAPEKAPLCINRKRVNAGELANMQNTACGEYADNEYNIWWNMQKSH